MGQIFATLLSNFWKKIKPQIEPIKEKIKEWKKRRAQMKKERERYSIGGHRPYKLLYLSRLRYCNMNEAIFVTLI